MSTNVGNRSTKTVKAVADNEDLDLIRLFRYTTETSPLPMVVVEGESHVVRQVNPAFCGLVARAREKLIGIIYAEAVPEGKENGCVALLDRVYATKQAESIAQQQHADTGSDLYWSYTAWPVLDREERSTGVLIQVTDTTEPVRFQKIASAINEALLISGVRQHEIAEIAVGLNHRMQRAMRETHHRVKNNLQIVSAIAELQMESDNPTVPISAMQRIADHARTLAALHDLLTQRAKDDAESETLDTQTVLYRLLPLLQATIGVRRLDHDIAAITLPIYQSGALSLLVSELVSNSVKHGKGDIFVRIELDRNVARLTVRDEGKGFPPNFDAQQSANTGLELIMSMARHDLRGDVKFTNRAEGGACSVVTFPVAVQANEPRPVT